MNPLLILLIETLPVVSEVERAKNYFYPWIILHRFKRASLVTSQNLLFLTIWETFFHFLRF